MKKILAFLLCAMMLVSMLALVACGNEKKSEEKSEESKTEESKPDDSTTLKFGLGVYVPTATVVNASADANGSASADATYAAVSVDANGKIVSVALDVMEHKVTFTLTGTTTESEFKSKYEKGDAYNMVAYGKGAALDGGDVQNEWYKQADAFKKAVIGKTLDEVKAMVITNADDEKMYNRGTEAVINAGCTIKINEFVNAIEEAYNNAKASNVTAAHTVKIAASTEQKVSFANVNADGSNEVNTTIFAAAVDADGKVVAAISDCLQMTFKFNTTGQCSFDTTKAIQTKREKGDAYNMVAFGKGAALNGGDVQNEWYKQADIFESFCIGKTGAEIVNLMVTNAADEKMNNRGTEEIINAGCTIEVNGFVAAASKI